jgi:hypothetical protein
MRRGMAKAKQPAATDIAWPLNVLELVAIAVRITTAAPAIPHVIV